MDADGVALAAIQGLYQVVQEQDAQIAALKAENAVQQQRITALEVRLAALEKAVGADDASARPGQADVNPTSTTRRPAGWLLLIGLSVIGLVLGQRWHTGDRR